MIEMKSIQEKLFPEYLLQIRDVSERFDGLRDAEISTETFSFYTSVSSVFSSKIEGEDIELDSFIKHKNFGIEFQPDYTKKIDDLYEAYQFAKDTDLNKKNILTAHQILSRNILQPHLQGVYRKDKMYVITDEGQIEYIAASPFEVPREMERFHEELDLLKSEDMDPKLVFFYAALIHLVFVKIHPMNDGNGRLARLLEKWFISEKLGEKAWFLQSEKMYYQQHQAYYNTIRKLGWEFETLNYEKALDFLLMLPQSLEI
jgi:Fic family protein